jgi:hypothetical protein
VRIGCIPVYKKRVIIQPSTSAFFLPGKTSSRKKQE